MGDLDEALIFLHIPKTGGSTLYKILRRHYSQTETITLDTPGVARFKTLPIAQRERYRLIQGHLCFGLHRFIPRASTYVTFLRQPVERAFSFYCYARSTPDHYLYPVLTNEHLDLRALLALDLTEELCNYQTRMLAGDEWEDPQRVVTRAALERAQANLRNGFRVVGLLEEFDATLLLLHRVFAWPLRVYVKENVTKEKPSAASLDVETRRLVEDANPLDLELYEYARNLFDEQCRAAGESFAADLSRFRELNGSCPGSGSRQVEPFRRILGWTRNSLRFR